MKISILFAVFCLLQTSFANANPILDRVFQETFHRSDIYIPSKCHDNIARLVQLATQAGVPATELTTIEFRPMAELWVYKGRDIRNKINPYGKRAYFHHVVLMAGNKIYDYDFTDQPRVLPVQAYFEEMMMSSYDKENFSDCVKSIGWNKLKIRKHITARETSDRDLYIKDSGWGCRR